MSGRGLKLSRVDFFGPGHCRPLVSGRGLKLDWLEWCSYGSWSPARERAWIETLWVTIARPVPYVARS